MYLHKYILATDSKNLLLCYTCCQLPEIPPYTKRETTKSPNWYENAFRLAYTES